MRKPADPIGGSKKKSRVETDDEDDKNFFKHWGVDKEPVSKPHVYRKRTRPKK